MKWFFFILLLINLGLLLLIYPQQQVEEVSPVLSDVGKLILVRELKQPESTVADSEKEDEDSEILTAGQSALVTPLMSEPEIDPAQMPEAYPQCVLVGSVEARADAEQISVRLRALGLKPELESESRNEQAGFWVLIPPQANRSEAVKIAKSLEKSGVSDLWRFTSGDLVHAISLGLFRDEARAAARKQEIDAMGYNSVVYPRHRKTTDYWLRYQIEGVSPVSAQDWAGLVNDYPGLTSKTIDCP